MMIKNQTGSAPRIYYYIIPLCLLLITGCTSTMQSGWSDFNAYFNTYYNAKTSFDRGVAQIERQQIAINPERPIRIHETPAQAGRQDFEYAIEKSADILRFHPQSRYVDNAIEIIGISYFYQRQYFSASQKFLELYSTTTSDRRKQSAIYWRGRSLLELEGYTEGLTYLSSQLYSSDLDWDEEIESQIKLVIGQLHVKNREWENAELYLSEGKQGISDRRILARAHFLHGQVLEQLQRYEEAMDAYSEAISRSNPEFNITYNANKKLAQMARILGDYQWSYDHLVSMTRDDNYFEFLGDLLYEVARTLHASGDFQGAHEEYIHLLRQTLSVPSRETIAKTYYGLAEIHKNYYQDYAMASAYYDSSATQATDLTRLPEHFDARLMADSYGNYSSLVEREQRLDSLLHLGSLPEEEFEAAIAAIQEEKIREMERMAAEQAREGTMVVSEEDLQVVDAAEETENGFLNHLNPQVMNQVSQTFRAYWGNRPLVDDWRRAEAVRLAAANRAESRERRSNSDEAPTEEELADEEFLEGDDFLEPQETQVIVDLSDIPFTDKDRARSREQIAETNYEIANVFFLTLNMPDSAKTRYYRVFNRYPDSQVAPQAMYSLAQTYNSVNDSIMARQIADELVESYPRSRFAVRIAEQFNIPLNYEPEEEVLSRQDSLNLIYSEVLQELEDGHSVDNAEKLKAFAYEHDDAERAPYALFRAATEYLTIARSDTLFRERVREINLAKTEWEQRQQDFQALQDSAQVMLQDTTLTDEERSEWQAVADSTLAPPALVDANPYQGALWDSARVVLADLSENYATFQAISRVERLRAEIREIEKEGDSEDDAYTEDQLDEMPLMTQNLDEFLMEHGLQEQANTMMVNTTFTLMITINEAGEPVQITSLDDEHEGSALLDNLIQALQEHGRFSPPTVDGQPVTARLEVFIPIEYR